MGRGAGGEVTRGRRWVVVVVELRLAGRALVVLQGVVVVGGRQVGHGPPGVAHWGAAGVAGGPRGVCWPPGMAVPGGRVLV